MPGLGRSPRPLSLACALLLMSLLAACGNAGGRAHGGTASTACRFQEATHPLHVAFCDTFSSSARPNQTRSGALDPVAWGVSRIAQSGGDTVNHPVGVNPSQGLEDAFAPATLDRCGTTRMVRPPDDVAMCAGNLVEAVYDAGGQTVLAMYPRQPFDIRGRTGTVTFNVSDATLGPHAVWPTFVYSDQPVPTPDNAGETPGVATAPRNGFGINFSGYCDQASNKFCPVGNPSACPERNDVTVGDMFIASNYGVTNLEAAPGSDTAATRLGTFTLLGCVARAIDPTRQNHVEITVSTSTVAVWMSDPGSDHLVEVAALTGAHLPLARGLVWMEDVHYNGNKFDHQPVATFGWSDFGFDGPVLPRDLGFDVPDRGALDAGSEQLGWSTGGAGSDPLTVHTVSGISRADLSAATGALVTFDFFPISRSVPTIRVDGHAAIPTPWPRAWVDDYEWRTMAVAVPLADIGPGAARIAFDNAPGGFANVDLILQGAGGRPTCLDPSSCGAGGGSR